MDSKSLEWYNFKENAKILKVEKEEDLSQKEEKFDYILFEDLKQLNEVTCLLKEDGTAILLVDNKFSISHFAGSKPAFGSVYETITKEDEKTFSKKQIEKALKEANLEYRFYYLFPTLDNPNVIFSSRYLPAENSSKLIYNVSYLPGSAVVFDELNALKQLTKNGYFEDFANCYIVEIGNIASYQPKFISYNPSRKKEYQLVTEIYETEVVKKKACQEAESHILQILKNTENLRKLGFEVIEQSRDGQIVSRFVNGQTLDKEIAGKILEGNLDDAICQIKSWYHYIGEKLPAVEENGLHMTRHGYIDLVFENTFFENGQFVFFDQEWFMEKVPVEFILYRALQNLYAYNREINHVYPYQQMLDLWGLTSYLEIFDQIEKEFQTKVIDEEKIAKNQASLDLLVDIHELALLNDYKENNRKQDAIIKSLEEDNRKKQEYIESLERSLNKKNKGFFRRKQ
ncbi:MAG: hypothetical protein IJ867_02465 [Clostridia bacterium]|nr:hypothetical protein [Clostridia bacterium]